MVIANVTACQSRMSAQTTATCILQQESIIVPFYSLPIRPESHHPWMSIRIGSNPSLLAYLKGYFNDSKNADKDKDGSQTCRMMAFDGNEPSSLRISPPHLHMTETRRDNRSILALYEH